MKSLKLLSIIAAFTTAGVLTSHAGDADLLNKLVEKGVLSQSEATHLADGSSHTVFKAKGKHTKKVRFNGRIQFQHNLFNGDETANPTTDDTNLFYLRRVYFGVKATLADDWYAELNIDFAGNGVAMDKAFIGYKGVENTKFKFGYSKIPFGYEETTSSSKLKAIERSAVNRYFIEESTFNGDNNLGAHHGGIFVEGKVADTGLKYAAAITNSRAGDNDEESWATGHTVDTLQYTGRLQYEFDLSDHGSLLLGGDATLQTMDEKSQTGDFTAYTIYADYKYEGFNLLAGFIWGEQENNGVAGTDNDPSGYYILGAYKFDGQWEPVVRYSHVDTDGINDIDSDGVIRRSPVDSVYQEVDSWFVGINWYILGNDVKLQTGYEWAEFENVAGVKDDMNGLRTQIQLLF